ncbi:MAG: hypothetical protein A4E57_00700 [Syntrophorhabdaceae bacterium PtaU1.Bin034]|nr:MAG: hypothetical protein A4E57_00700 [Syntrophorhabdaceae bacterium PtaU1.Bin034]
MRKMLRTINCFWVLFIASCVTVNVYFPAAAVQKAADAIVEDVTEEGGQPANAPAPKQGPSSRLNDFLKDLTFGPAEAQAQVDVNVSTPAIRSLKDSMRNLYRQLKPYYEKGVVGEGNKGFVEIRDAGPLNLQERGQVSAWVDQQNKARSSLYKEIAVANKLGQESVPQIQKIFSNSWRDKSKPGWWIQNDSGAWEQKK